MSGRVILAGGSGFIGTMLARELLARGYKVVILSRRGSAQNSFVTRHSSSTTLPWDGQSIGEWAGGLDGAKAIVNLAGRSVNCRHTEWNRRKIIESRVNSVKVISEALKNCARPPGVWVQAGGEGIYGDYGEGCCEESTPSTEGFLVDICRLWEGAFNEALTPNTRHVLLRIGFVLGKDGGALEVLARLTKWGLGGAAGNGRQYINWIHGADLCRMFVAAIEEPGMEGVFNASGPEPVTNAEFMRELRRVLHRPWSPPAPAWAVRLGAWLMGSDGRLALTGRCCVPKRILDRGFRFEFEELSGALVDLHA
jgi:uncharacterized protein (TIGR01777 family)